MYKVTEKYEKKIKLHLKKIEDLKKKQDEQEVKKSN